jgi:sugar lactone lactonase YvrE
MAVEVRSASLSSLIDPAAELSCVGGGFAFTEGPVWSRAEECLYFSDIPGDARWRWSERAGMELVLRPCFKANGLVLDKDGNLLACEHVTSSVVRFRPDGTRELLAHHLGGKYLNSPNDIVVRSFDGSVYFTDPITAVGTTGLASRESLSSASRPSSGRRPTRPAKHTRSLLKASSTNPTASASHPTKASSMSTTHRERTSRCSMSSPTAPWTTPGSSSTALARASTRPLVPSRIRKPVTRSSTTLVPSTG